MEVVTKCWLSEGKAVEVVDVPTTFVYTAMKADKEETDEEFQFYEIRSYFDFGLVEKGKALQKK